MSVCLHYKLGNSGFNINVKLSFTILCLLTFFLCLFLGHWQVKRYHFKQTLLTEFNHQLASTPETFNGLDDVKPFQRLRVKGEFGQTVFLSNRFFKGKPGYEIYTTLNVPNLSKKILIDRGWSQDAIATPQQAVELEGYAKFTNEYQFILGNNILQDSQNRIILQKIDVMDLKKITHQDYFPFVIRIDEKSKFALPRDWVISSVEPERHMGYAIQWYALALVIALLFIYYSVQRETHEN